MSVVYGVDGCPGPRGSRGAWLVVGFEERDGFGSAVMAESFRAVVDVTGDGELILVDIPIGLPDSGHPARACDVEARRAIGARRSTVFPPPSRAALTAADHPAASAANRLVIGKGLSQQAWGICPRIADVDSVLRSRPKLRPRYRESHPEVCFTALNAWRPMVHPKRDRAGTMERLALLSAHARNARESVERIASRWRRAEVKLHDILDAMVLAVVAKDALTVGCPTLPAQPEIDAEGLPMEMVCPSRPA